MSGALTKGGPHPGPVLETVNGLDVVDCGACGYAHVLQMPTLEELRKLYHEKFYGEDKADYLVRMEEDLEWWDMVYQERLETIEGLLPGGAPRKILDVGSSGGFFLESARKRDWDTVGVELGRQAVEHARAKGLTILQEDVHDVDLSKLGPFGAIYCSFVLEHLPDPVEVLGKLRAALAPGGVVCLEVPNDFNPFQRIVKEALGAKPYWVAPDHHLNYFTPATIEKAVQRAGLECVRRDGTFPMELFLLMGDNYIGNDPVGRQLHGKRKLFELRLVSGGMGSFKRSLYRFCIDQGVGREVVLYAAPRR